MSTELAILDQSVTIKSVKKKRGPNFMISEVPKWEKPNLLPKLSCERADFLLKTGEYGFVDSPLRTAEVDWSTSDGPVFFASFYRMLNLKTALSHIRKAGYESAGFGQMLFYGANKTVSDGDHCVIVPKIWKHPTTGCKYVYYIADLGILGYHGNDPEVDTASRFHKRWIGLWPIDDWFPPGTKFLVVPKAVKDSP